VLAGAFADRGLVLTGVVAACRPAGAGWEADLLVGEAMITCRLRDKPPATDREFAVTALDPPYFGADGSGLPARATESDTVGPQQVHRLLKWPLTWQVRGHRNHRLSPRRRTPATRRGSS
jgi:hypothetical protein